MLHVEVSPDQRWTAGSRAPVQVFYVFDLTQDLTAYVNKSRVEVAECCLTRGGRVSCLFFLLLSLLSFPPFLSSGFDIVVCFFVLQFLSNLIHIVNDYKADVDHQWRDRSIQELADAKEGKLDAERRAVESEKREVEVTKKSFLEKLS